MATIIFKKKKANYIIKWSYLIVWVIVIIFATKNNFVYDIEVTLKPKHYIIQIINAKTGNNYIRSLTIKEKEPYE